MNLKEALNFVISKEESLDLALNLLTEIGLNSSSDEIFSATEEVRNELVCNKENTEIRADILRGHEHPYHISNFQL